MGNDLRLQVLLSAIDKATGPLNKITGGSKETARALKAARDRLKELNTQQRDISAWRELQAATRATSEALAANNTKVGELARETAKVRQQLAPTQALFDKSRQKVDALKTSQTDLKRELTGTRNALGLMSDEHRQSASQIAALNAVMQKGNALTRAQHDEYTRLTAAQRERKTQLDQLAAKEKTLADRFTLNNAQLRTSRAGHASLRDEIRRLESPFKDQLALLKQHTAESKRLGEQYGQQQVKLGNLGVQLKNAGISTNALGAHELKLKRDMDVATRAMKVQMDRLDALKRKQEHLAQARSNYDKGKQLAGSTAVSGAAGLGVAYAASRPVIGVVKEYVDFETAMMGVAKQVDGARDDNGKLTSTYYEFADAIKAATNEMPIATTEFAALVEAQARAGIQGKENLLTMAKVSATAAVAFDLPAEQVGEDMGRIAGLYKVPIKNIAELGDALNYLDDNTRSKGGDIIETLTRMSDVADKLDYRKAAALGSTFLSLGSAPEVAASASRAMVRELAIATMQGKKFQEGMAMVGLDSKAVQSGMTTDAMGTMMDVLERIKKLSAEQQTEVSTRLFGKEFGKDAGKLVNNLEELRRQLKLVDDTAAKGSMQREMDVRADAIVGRWQVLQNKLFNTKSGAGEAVRATMIEVMDAIGSVLDKINAWIKANPTLAATLLKMVAGVAALSAVFGGLALALAAILGPMVLVRYGMTVFGVRGASLIRTLSGIGLGTDVFAKKSGLLGRALVGLQSLASRMSGRLQESWLAASPSRLIQKVKALPINIKDSVNAARTWSQNAGPRLAASFKQTAQATWAYTTGPLRSVSQGLRSAVISAMANIRANGLLGASYNLLKGGMTSLMAAIRGGVVAAFSRAASGVRLLGQAFLFTGRALLLNPIGLLITAIAASALLIYKYWGPIKAFVKGFWDGLTEGLAPLEQSLTPAFAALGTVLEPLKPLWDSITSALGTAWSWFTKLFAPIESTREELDNATNSGKAFGLWLAGLINQLAEFIEKMVTFGADLITGLIKGITGMGTALKDSITGMADSTLGWFKEKLGMGVEVPISHDLSGVRKQINQTRQLALGPMANVPPLMTPPMREPAPRLLDMSKKLAASSSLALRVTTAPALEVDERPPIPLARPAPSYTSQDVYHISVPTAPGQDAHAIARAVAAELSRRDNEKKARNRSKLSDQE